MKPTADQLIQWHKDWLKKCRLEGFTSWNEYLVHCGYELGAEQMKERSAALCNEVAAGRDADAIRKGMP